MTIPEGERQGEPEEKGDAMEDMESKTVARLI